MNKVITALNPVLSSVYAPQRVMAAAFFAEVITLYKATVNVGWILFYSTKHIKAGIMIILGRGDYQHGLINILTHKFPYLLTCNLILFQLINCKCGGDLALVEMLINGLLGRLVDSSQVVRKLCIRGLGNVASNGADQVGGDYFLKFWENAFIIQADNIVTIYALKRL